MGERNSLYLGRAGQLAVMSEFVARGWNAAIPEVDVGDDILVIRDEDGSFSRMCTGLLQPDAWAYCTPS